MSEELKPCPFCGCEADLNIVDEVGPNWNGHYVECKNKQCAATTPLIFSCGDDPKPLLIERWNNRAKFV